MEHTEDFYSTVSKRKGVTFKQLIEPPTNSFLHIAKTCAFQNREAEIYSYQFPIYGSQITQAIQLIVNKRVIWNEHEERLQERTYENIPDLIIDFETRWNDRNIEGETLIFQAVKSRNVRGVKFILKRGIDSKLITKKEMDLFNQAIITRDERILQILLDARIKPENNLCPYIVAMENKAAQFVPLLWANNYRPYDPLKAFQTAVRIGDIQIIKILHTNKNTGRSMNPLHEAVRQDYKVLGYEIEIPTQDGCSPLQIAFAAGHNHLVTLTAENNDEEMLVLIWGIGVPLYNSPRESLLTPQNYSVGVKTLPSYRTKRRTIYEQAVKGQLDEFCRKIDDTKNPYITELQAIF
ncbi:hypothetical protein TSAR_003668 [Trichomalopsis sarcophagae]|uniref:Uncharacterized protein n=1 Tax=Trichomalopsis sarcophagae TaxID=543379 RepID=A0A232EU03_9HYME|nr:hypothetical protein TSAR_003668 [Trichomalopsis sarcophagae]